jgi:hypothetical protein
MTNNKQQTALDFVPYELALELKQLGFDEPCLGYYIANTLFISNDIVHNSTDIPVIKAPLYSQAFRWFREKHELDVNIHSIYTVFTCSPNEPPSKVYNVYAFNKHTPTTVGCYNTYEEAELACLRKLIEIANDKQ